MILVFKKLAINTDHIVTITESDTDDYTILHMTNGTSPIINVPFLDILHRLDEIYEQIEKRT